MKVIILQDDLFSAFNYEMTMDELNIQILGIYHTWKEALSASKRDFPDLIIVDLYKGEKELSYVSELNHFLCPALICSAYPEINEMDAALESGVWAFLPKPLNKVALIFEIKKILRELGQEKRPKDYMVIREKRNLIKLPYRRITRIQIDGNYSYVYLETNKKYVLKLSLKRIMGQLDNQIFVRCHRSTIVNINHLESIDLKDNKINMLNNVSLDIGSKYKRSIKEAFFKKWE